MRRCSNTKRLLVLALALTAGACQTVYTGLPPIKRDHASDYDPVLGVYTRHVRLYNGVERILIATATVETNTFLRARFLEDARIHDRASEEAGPLEAVFKTERQGLTVVLFFDATLPKWEDLDTRESIWRVSLEIGKVVHEPTKVRALDEQDVTLRHLYPYTNPFGTLYELIFPISRDAATGAATIRISGVPARVSLVFDL